jgi:hypothetical protein
LVDLLSVAYLIPTSRMMSVRCRRRRVARRGGVPMPPRTGRSPGPSWRALGWTGKPGPSGPRAFLGGASLTITLWSPGRLWPPFAGVSRAGPYLASPKKNVARPGAHSPIRLRASKPIRNNQSSMLVVMVPIVPTFPLPPPRHRDCRATSARTDSLRVAGPSSTRSSAGCPEVAAIETPEAWSNAGPQNSVTR